MMVVTVAPVVEGGLGVCKVSEGPAEQFGLEGAVEALVLAVALGMQGGTVPGVDAVLDQPHAELRQALAVGIAPRAAIVGLDGAGQTVALEGLLQSLLHGAGTLVV